MQRIKALDPAKATGKAKELLKEVESKFSRVPNMHKTLANSPAALEAYMLASDALSKGSLDPKIRSCVALAVSEADGSEYCTAANTFLSKGTGLSDAEAVAARSGNPSDPKCAAAVTFARRLVTSRGDPTDSDLAALRRAGLSDGDIAEIIGQIGVNVFGNYFNRSAATEIDFPRVAVHA